jgi:Tol biopolymer transport system component
MRRTSLVLASLLLAPLVHGQIGGTWTELCDLSTTGAQAGIGPWAGGYEISDDGRFVVFAAPDALDPRDFTGTGTAGYDIYVRDLELDLTTLVSLDANNANAVGWCAATDTAGPSISASGRYVAFSSAASGLVAGDPGLDWDVFVRDLQTQVTVRCSITTSGAEPNNTCWRCSISSDGRYVAFVSGATNIVPGATSGAQQIYRFDRVSGQIALVSASAAGTPGGNSSLEPRLSADGRFVVFSSDSSNFGFVDPNGASDVYRKDMLTGQVALVTMDFTTGGAPNLGVFAQSGAPSVSADGRFVAFNTLVPFAANDVTTGDVYLRDMLANTHTLISVGTSGLSVGGGMGDLSADGRHVVFSSASGALVPNDNNGFSDVFVRDLALARTTRESVSYAGGDANGHVGSLSLSANGRRLVMYSQCTNLVALDNNGIWPDLFARDRGPSATPQVYCVAQQNSLGCTPAIAFAGVPSATNANPFTLAASQLLNNKAGNLFFGLSGPQLQPFLGGYLCVRPPTVRTGTLFSGGTPFGSDCTGQFYLDFNAYIASGTQPALQIPGTEFWAQIWSRDPASPSTTNLTDAIEALVQP